MSDTPGVLARLKALFGGDRAAGEPSDQVPSPPYGEGEMPEGCEEVGEISCEEAVQRVYEFLDGELTDEKTREVRCHVEKCKRCYPMYNWERMFLEFVQGRASREESNPALREQVEELLDREETDGGS